jgi:transposase-like protein
MTQSIVPQDVTSDNIHRLGDSTDALRDLLADTLDAVMRQEVAAQLNADSYERHDDREGYRNGTRSRRFDTRMGTLELQIPRVRGVESPYMPSFLTHRERCEAALVSLVHEAYVGGVSTRKVQKLVDALGVKSLSKSQVSDLNKQLDVLVREFRERQLTAVYPYLLFDAVYEKIRFEGRSQSHAVVIAYGITDQGTRELIGIEIVDTERFESWSDFFRKLQMRGLRGVKLVISDAHAGLKRAIAEMFLGTTWQRCKVHFMRNVLAAVPKTYKEAVAADLKRIFQHDQTKKHAPKELRKDAMAEVERVLEKHGERHSRAMQILLDGIDDALAYLDFPSEHAAKISSTNPIERINREIRRRTRVVGVFPSIDSAMRLIGMVLLEQTQEWEAQRGYMSLESMQQIALMT